MGVHLRDGRVLSWLLLEQGGTAKWLFWEAEIYMPIFRTNLSAEDKSCNFKKYTQKEDQERD